MRAIFLVFFSLSDYNATRLVLWASSLETEPLPDLTEFCCYFVAALRINATLAYHAIAECHAK